MSTPIREKEQYSFPAFDNDSQARKQDDQSSEEDGTLNDGSERHRLRVTTSYSTGPEYLHAPPRGVSPMSPSQQREQSRRLDDDLQMLKAERVVSNAESQQTDLNRNRSMARSKSRANNEPEDDFDIGTTPVHEKTKIYKPPAHPATRMAKLFKKIHQSSFLVRWFFYITPITLILLIPLLLGALKFKSASVGGVKLIWFSIWLEIVWLTLWLGRIIAKCIPYPLGLISSLFTNNSKKWRDLGKQLEVPATLFFWMLAVEISFLPTMIHHHNDGSTATRSWEITTNKVLISIFVCAILNFVEKIIIQLIAISFHLRTYADRIDVNKFQIGSLVKLYIYSKDKIAMEDSEFEAHVQTGPPSGTRTPMQLVEKAGKQAKQAFTKVGDVAGKVAGDFTGRAVTQSTHPHQVVLTLLSTTVGGQVLARRLYRTFAKEDSETVLSEDLRPAFDNDDEADAAFSMFDRDLNGDISMEELEAVCVEIGRERKAITASLKDLDSVVSKLDDVLFFIVAVVTILVFVSLISTSASGVLTSAGSAVLALSWLFSATAQEFLQSVIFVFVKHPFDVGDRVTIYGNTGSMMKGDDYFVKEISLLFTEFKKMEGHVVQAPNSYLNTLFILNQRRSGGLAEAIPVVIKFGTTLEQIETLRNRLLEFVTSETREYQKNILTELRDVTEAYSITLNVVFFYKSNWQNELLRLQRRNKFICALMVTMQDLGIEGPRQNLAGQSTQMPMYLNNAYPNAPPPEYQNQAAHDNNNGPGPRSGSLARDHSDPSPAPPPNSAIGFNTHPSILRNRGESVSGRARGESIAQMGKRVDFSLGMSGISSGANMGDVYDDVPVRPRLPTVTSSSQSPPPHGRSSRDIPGTSDSDGDGGMLGKTFSRDSGSAKGGKTSLDSLRPSHRNRFFGRSRERSKLGSADEGTDMDDLEAGRFIRAEDMPDIPEASGINTGTSTAKSGLLDAGNGKGRGRRSSSGEYAGPRMTGAAMHGRIDPRTGIESPQAVARDSAIGRGVLPMQTGSGVRRVQTDL